MWLLAAAAEILEREVGNEGHGSGPQPAYSGQDLPRQPLDSFQVAPALILVRSSSVWSDTSTTSAKKICFFLSCYVILSSFLNWWCSVCKLIEII
jgi:hypothetical protein